MSKTLFWYLLKDLLRIFVMTSGTLAGIMSFGALLRPLTQHGLGLGQVGQILSYFSPAMTTYSLPIAALFATTIVYGRLSADNELTACRASGISSIMMTAPAFLLGLIVALISLAFLSFVVPIFTLKVEKVIYSNIAQLVENRITRTHEITYGRTSIFAQAAEVQLPDEVLLATTDPQLTARVIEHLRNAGLTPRESGSLIRTPYAGKSWQPILKALIESLNEKEPLNIRGIVSYKAPNGTTSVQQPSWEALLPLAALAEVVDDQVVDLFSPIIFTYATVEAPEPDNATELVTKPADKNDRSHLMKVPSKIWIAKRATAYIGPRGDKVQLRAVLADGANFPRGTGGSQLSVTQAEFGPIDMGTPIRENTKFMTVPELKRLLSNPESSRRLQSIVQQFVRDEQRDVYFKQIENSLKNPALKSFRFDAETESLVISGADLQIRNRGNELVINPRTEQETARVLVERQRDGAAEFQDHAKQIRITLDPVDPVPGSPVRRMVVHIQGYDTIFEGDEDPAAHETLPHTINIPMPENLLALEKNNVRHYLDMKAGGKKELEDLKYNYNKLNASIRSEMHSRASFAVSCFILVMVGCALGMISRSGNFLSAFAVSVVPALLCIALIVTGQHVCENTPKSMGLGLSLVWSGNVIVLILATFLLGKLQRQ